MLFAATADPILRLPTGLDSLSESTSIWAEAPHSEHSTALEPVLKLQVCTAPVGFEPFCVVTLHSAGSSLHLSLS